MSKLQVLASNDNSGQPTDRRFGFEADIQMPSDVRQANARSAGT
jgi:hypothetical protein